MVGLPHESMLDAASPLAKYRPALIMAGFGCVVFSLVVQGLTMPPLMRRLGISEEARAGDALHQAAVGSNLLSSQTA